jgi:signal peptidase II
MPTMPSPQKWRPVLAWGLVVLALDLLTKVLARRLLSPLEPLEVIDGFFSLILAFNTGAAFSLLAGDGLGQGVKMALLATLSLLPFGFFFFAKADPRNRPLLTALGLIWGGALGNIYDRLCRGAVTDFLDFQIRGHHWPAFNIADMAICLGAGLMTLCILKEKPPK